MRMAIWPICQEPPLSSTTTPLGVTTKVMLAIMPWLACVGKPSLAKIIQVFLPKRSGLMSGIGGPSMKSCNCWAARRTSGTMLKPAAPKPMPPAQRRKSRRRFKTWGRAGVLGRWGMECPEGFSQ